MSFKPIVAASIAFLLSFTVLAVPLAFLSLIFFGQRQGGPYTILPTETALMAVGALLFVISTWFAFKVYRRVAAVGAGAFVKPAHEEITLKRRFRLVGSILGFAILLAGLWRLDIPLLARHETTRGWITGISIDPSRRTSKGNYTRTTHYAYNDKDGVYYQRTAWVSIGYERQGDGFTVFYHPDKPGRHSVLTLWRQAIPLGLILIGLFIGLGSAAKARRFEAR
ncbi:MAG: DUF3592 domain-containing protein [Deltaproteobacteria bacterium]|nr:DUF3592 domain-containing protein [Deltaproteobacteria bacterium]